MHTHQTQGPFCQSCGMPMHRPEDFGTESTGYHANDFCRYCYVNGVFTEPGISFQAMLNRCTEKLADQGIVPEFHARVLMADVLPRLKRWRTPVEDAV
jgi:hypothetical protein